MNASGTTAVTRDDVLQTLERWNHMLNRAIRLIAWGDTALTLLNITPSASEVAFCVPVSEEHAYLLKFLHANGYLSDERGLTHPETPGVWYQFWPGMPLFPTERSACPFEMNPPRPMRNWPHLELSVMDWTDLILTQLFQGTAAGIKHGIAVFKTWQVDAEDLLNRYAQMLTCVPQPEPKLHTFMAFVEKLVSQQLVSDDFLKKVMQEKGGLLKKHAGLS